VAATPFAPASARSRPRRLGGQTAEAILDAAEALFAERGFEGASLRDVADRVGVRAPSLYNHFESKEALYTAVLERGVGPVLELLASVAARPDAIDRRRVVTEVMATLARHPNLARLLQHETLTGGRRLTPLLERFIAPALASAEALIASDPNARRWSAEQIPHLVLALYHTVVGYFAVADLYEDMRGEDLLAPPALERQTRFLHQLVSTLFPDPAA
jgi:TetR/AcrR family transcriptional regulator